MISNDIEFCIGPNDNLIIVHKSLTYISFGGRKKASSCVMCVKPVMLHWHTVITAPRWVAADHLMCALCLHRVYHTQSEHAAALEPITSFK